MAQPSKYTPELFAEICERLSKGEPLAQICRDEHMPSDRTVGNWRDSDPALASAIARAREAGFDAIALEALRIADDKEGEHQRDRLRVDTRLKLLAKWDPKRYGDKLQVGGDPDGTPMQMICSWLSPE
jgi:hypothetical protein